MSLDYILSTIPLVISFAMATGKLNENFYIKSFAFGFAFIIMLVLNAIKGRKTTNTNVSVCTTDMLVFGLMMVFLYSYTGLLNVIDHSILLMYFLLYFFIRLYSNIDFSRILLYIAPSIILIHLLLCTLQYFSLLPNYNHFFNIGSTFGNPDMLSAYLSILLPFCYIGHQWKIARWLIVLLTISLFFLLQARTAIMASLLVMSCYFVLKYRRIPKKYILIAIVIFSIGLICLACWHKASVLGRLYIWVVSLSMFIAKPLGWGAYAFEKYYPEYQAQFTVQHPEIVEILNYDIVHSPYNEFLNIAVTVGIMGIFFYVMFVFRVLRMTYRAKSILFFPLLTFQIISLSYFPFQIIPLSAFYVMCCAIAVKTYDSASSTFTLFIPSKVKRTLIYTIAFGVVLCCSCNVYSFFYWEKAIAQMDKREYAEANNSFGKSYPFLKNNGRFLTSFAELKYKMGDDDETLSLMEKASYHFSDISFLHNWAMLYEQKGMIDKAKEKLNLAVNMSPDNIDIRFAQIQFLQRIGEIKEAHQQAILLKNRIKENNRESNNEMILIALDKLITY